MTRYVQHISGQGERWIIASETGLRWRVKATVDRDYQKDLELPKSEYKECEPPERWVDVTERCDMGKVQLGFKADLYDHHEHGYSSFAVFNREDYRLRKVQLHEASPGAVISKLQWAFLVEKRQL